LESGTQQGHRRKLGKTEDMWKERVVTVLGRTVKLVTMKSKEVRV